MTPTGKRLIVVLGMHRSGSSMITRALNVLGVELGDRLLPPVQGDNAKGYFEDIDLNALNIEMLHALGSDWHCLAPIEPSDVESLQNKGYFLRAATLLRQKAADVAIFGFKDPRVAKLLPFWQPVFEHCEFDIGYVLAVRNPLSVADSLAKRAGFNPEKSYMLWLGHVLASLVHTEEHRRVLVDYDHFLHAPQKGLELIANRLALQVDTQALQHYQSEFLDKELRHTVYSVNDLTVDQTCSPLVRELYAGLIEASRDTKRIDSPEFLTRTAYWSNEFDRLKSNLRWIDNLSTQISNLNQSINVRDGEITDLIRAALKQDQKVFQKSFDSEWYLKKYPDIAAAGVDPYEHYTQHGVQEGRLPSADLSAFILHSWLGRSIELNTQLNQAKLLTESQLLELAGRENAFSQQLQEMRQVHEQKTGEKSREYTEREQAYLAQLAQARQQIETYLLALAEREKAFSQQLQAMQQAHAQQKGEQSREHAEREQAHLAQLALARQQTEAQLRALAEREKAFSQQLQAMQQAHEQQKGEQSREHAEREQVFNAHLLARQEELSSLSNRWAETEKAHALVLSELHRELDAIRSTYSWRWTASLRKLASLVGLKNSDGSNTAPPTASEVPANDQITNLAAQAIKTPLIFLQSSSDNINGIIDMPMSHASAAAGTLEELLSYHDERFIHSAYYTLLGRAPDLEGMRYYLSRVRAGISKVEILTQLRMSVEGKSKQISINGLNRAIKQYQRQKTSLLGALFRLFGMSYLEGDGTQKKLRAIENKLHALDVQLNHRFTEINKAVSQLKKLIESKEQVLAAPEPETSSMHSQEQAVMKPHENDVFTILDTDWYLEQNPDVAKSGMTPYEHYILHGQKEGRHPAFDRDWYLNRYPDVAASGMDPLNHYILHGKAEGRYPAYSLFNADGNNYPKWILDFDTLTEEMRGAMRTQSKRFGYKPLISVVMPVYNPNPIWLVEVIESVRNQIYPNWELCIADDLSSDKAIRPILERYSKEDNRIKVVFRTQNGHISNATNSALEVARGEWIALLDHDDILPEHALFWVVDAINSNPEIRMIYSDEDKINEQGSRFGPYFKCDWNPDLFYSHNMFSHLGVYHSELIRQVSGFRVGLEGSQDYDLALRCIEHITPKQIHHIPRVLYHWRVHAESTASSSDAKPYAMIAGERAINEHLERKGVNAKAELIIYGYRVRYALPDILPLVSLIIPTRNGLKLLRQCMESIVQKTTYSNYEIVIVDNGSDDPATLRYLDKIASESRVRVVRDDRPFNYSALNNAAVKLARGEIIGLINNDIEVISPDWLSEMVSHALRPEVGAVGAKLLYPNETIQHAGILLGVTGIAAHAHKNLPRNSHGYFSRANLIQSFSAVTAACLVVRKSVYESLGGLNEVDLQVAFNDVDFCVRVREAGYRNIWTPYAELYHHESATRGYEDSPEKQARFAKEVAYMEHRKLLTSDPAYSPNLTLDNDDFSLAWPPRVKNFALPIQ